MISLSELYTNLYDVKSVLDIGVGDGLFGSQARYVLDLQYGRYNAEDWETIISGIAFDNSESPLLEMYTNIEVTENFDLNRCGGYDLVFLHDVVVDQETLNILKSINKRVIEIEY